MKKKKLQEFRNKSDGELMRDLAENRERLSRLLFDLAQGKVKNISEIKEVKRTIARILTLMSQKK